MMSKWRYTVQRGNNFASRPIEFPDITDALAYIYGSERFSPHFSAEYIIRKIEVNSELDNKKLKDEI